MASTIDPLSPPPTSKVVTAGLTLAVLFAAGCYIVGLAYLYRYSKRWQNKGGKFSEPNFQTGVMVFYASLVLFSLLEASIAIWLLAQYGHTGRFANVGSRDGVRLGLFSASWTMVSSSVFLVIIIAAVSRQFIASIECQAIWILLTWPMWVATTATLNRALPLISPKRKCAGADFCTQLQAGFGFALAHVILLTIVRRRPHILYRAVENGMNGLATLLIYLLKCIFCLQCISRNLNLSVREAPRGNGLHYISEYEQSGVRKKDVSSV